MGKTSPLVSMRASDLQTEENIVIRAPNWVGDIVMAIPFYRCIRENFPDAGIFCCIRHYVDGILDGAPWFDGIITGNDKTFAGLMGMMKAVRRLRPKIAFVLPRSIHALVPILLGGAKQVYSYRQNGRGLLLTGGPLHPKAGKVASTIPTMEHYLNLARWLNLTMPSSLRPELFVTATEQSFSDLKFSEYGIAAEETVIGLNPGAHFGASKCWPPAYFARLAEMLQDALDCRILIFAGPGEGQIAAHIERSSRAILINTFDDRINLSQLKPMIKRCDLLITNDTGPRHYAVAFRVPVVVIMGPTNPIYTETHLENTVVIRKALDCSPCHLKICPGNHDCMTATSPEEVFEQSIKLLRKRPHVH